MSRTVTVSDRVSIGQDQLDRLARQRATLGRPGQIESKVGGGIRARDRRTSTWAEVINCLDRRNHLGAN